MSHQLLHVRFSSSSLSYNKYGGNRSSILVRLIRQLVTSIVLYVLVTTITITTTTTAANLQNTSSYKNPFVRGCLAHHHTMIPGWSNDKIRACNSEDDDDDDDDDENRNDENENDTTIRLCHPSELDYLEIRIYSQNWDSVIYETWILQIILSELLNVPTSVEIGIPTKNNYNYNETETENAVSSPTSSSSSSSSSSRSSSSSSSSSITNFYHPMNTIEYGTGADWNTVRNAAKYGDCRLVATATKNHHHHYHHPRDEMDENDVEMVNEDEDNYVPCAHVITEVGWDQLNLEAHTLVQEGIVEPPQALGAQGSENWFVPKFTAERDPSLLSYFGLQGEQHRRKLAETFLRPTTWKLYCDTISLTHCLVQHHDDHPILPLSGGNSTFATTNITTNYTTKDHDTPIIAQRPPHPGTDEETRMFVPGLYMGHFRNTSQNDCDTNPTTCTGHVTDYPCQWTSYVEAQAYHLNIAVESNGNEPGSGGYTYSQMMEIWKAANATKSNVLMYWWTPDALYQEFLGTDAEFQRISFPPTNKACVKSRVNRADTCSEHKLDRVGDPAGICEEGATPLHKLVSTGLYNAIHDPSIPEAKRSPGYEVMQRFRISEIELGDIFDLVKIANSPREGVCQWVVNNLDYVKGWIPRNYPRVVVDGHDHLGLRYGTMALGGFATIGTLLVGGLVFRLRDRRVIRYAQVEFLGLLVAGLITIAIGALVVGMPPTDASCIASMWLVNFGYTLELIPLIVKVAAINKLMHAATQMRRVILKQRNLFRTVVVLSGFMVAFQLLWTIMDPPRRQAEYIMRDIVTEDGASVVEVNYYCGSEKSDVWEFAAVGWNIVLLVCATVLAFQSRNIRQDFNESGTLAMMAYSHFVFVMLRVVTFILSTNGDESGIRKSVLARCRSLIFSGDVIATIILYFVPKFIPEAIGQYNRSSIFLGGGTTVSMQVVNPFPIPKRWSSIKSQENMANNVEQRRDSLEVLPPKSQDRVSEALEDGSNVGPTRVSFVTKDAPEDDNTIGTTSNISPVLPTASNSKAGVTSLENISDVGLRCRHCGQLGPLPEEMHPLHESLEDDSVISG